MPFPKLVILDGRVGSPTRREGSQQWWNIGSWRHDFNMLAEILQDHGASLIEDSGCGMP